MEELLTYVTFFVEVGILNYLNFRIYKTFLTPIACLSIPFTLVLLICLICNVSIGFIPFHYEALWVWIMGLFFFGIPGILVFRKTSHEQKNWTLLRNIGFTKCIIGICLLYMLTQLGSLSDYDLGSKELGGELAVGGLKGRISNVLLVACPLMACINYNKYLKCIIVGLIFYILLAFGSKTWILYAFAACILCLYQQKKISFNIWSFLFSIVGMLMIFGIYYSLNTEIEDFVHLIEFVSRHFYFYLTSGLLPLSEFVYRGTAQSVGEFVLPFFNIVDIWLGNPGVSVHSPLWYTTDNILGTQSNVFTFFGSLYMGDSLLAFWGYSFLFGFISYMIYRVSMRKHNLFLQIMNAYNCCVLFFGWYNCTYGILRIWEIFVYSYFFYLLSNSEVDKQK